MDLYNGNFYGHQCYVKQDRYLSSLPSFEKPYQVVTRVQANDLELTWILCSCKTYEEANSMAKRFNDIWREQYYKMIAKETLDSILGKEIPYEI